MRERSTWNLQEIAKKAANKQAAEVAGDIYSMNQDHPQPAADEYVIGGPSDFAEDVHQPNTWESEYSDGQTARDEIGMPKLRKDTFNHAEKTAADHVRLKKAELCVAVAKMMLRGTRVASVDAIEDQAYGLMYMPDQELINTHRRLTAEQEGDDVDDDSDDDGAQDKQAGEIPPQFKKNIEKMKAKSKDKGDDDKGDDDSDDDDDGESQQKQGNQKPDFLEDIEDDDDDGEKKQANQDADDDDDDEGQGQEKQANQDQVGQMQQMMGQLQQMIQQAQGQQQLPEEPAQQQVLAKSKSKTSQGVKEPKNEGGDQNAKANDNWPTKSASAQLAQMQQMMGQLQQMIQQAQGQQLPGQQAPVMAQGDELDQMLAQQDCGPMAEGDIEMEPAPMDVDNVVLAGEDEVLRHLFAQDEQDQGEEEQVQETQAKQAAIRTASTRTVGTRPTSGVAKLGGSVSKTAASKETDRLSSLWQTAPDVRESFGLK